MDEKKSIPIEKNNKYIVNIIDNGSEGEGIAKINDFTIFVPGAIKDEKCEILILKVNKNFAYGKLLNIISESKYRQKADCCTYKRCGGCELRHIKYEYTLKMKQEKVQNLLNKSLKQPIDVDETIGMKEPFNYRNKLQYPIGKNKEGKPIIGVFVKKSHEIIETSNCLIQNKDSEEIANYIIKLIKDNNIPVYDEKTLTGQIRHLVIKIGVKTKEIMCIIVSNEKEITNENILVEKLTNRFPNIKTIIKNINNKNTNVILGNENVVLYGQGYITDKLDEYTFKISPMSFYQTNPVQTEILYNTAIGLAELKKDDILMDLYCGIGTIGIFASKYVKKVYGIEIIKEAVNDAIENAKINNINNIDFMVGDVEKVFDDFINKKRDNPTVIFVDPPRKGLDTNTINNILNLETPRVVYISCNPATMARDLKLLEEKYNIVKIQPVDMFPYTSHVECVTVLYAKETL